MEMQFLDGFTEWQSSPEITRVNTMKARTSFVPYDTLDMALSCQKHLSARFISLNGQWKFKLFKNYTKVEFGFAEPHFNSEKWKTITVPSNWETEGWGTPQYCNIQYPWEGNERVSPPNAPLEYNPVGCYIKRITLPDEFRRKRVILTLDGVQSGFYLYINGLRLGYSESSFNTVEFDITKALYPGENVIALEVFKFTTGSWLEDQDYWRLGGVFRDVYLTCTGDGYIEDYTLKHELDSSFKSGVLSADVILSGYIDNHELEMTVYDANGDIAAMSQKTAVGMGKVTLKATVPFVKLWSCEKPYLYTVVFTLRNSRGLEQELVSCKTGFRLIEMKNGILYLNRKRLVLKGINRHEFCAETGRAVSEETMRKDIMLIKANNMNAVRTSHYPNSPLWYDLCDEYGIYVIDENNLETHGTRGKAFKSTPLIPSSRPEWENAAEERIEALYERDKNHPCVIAWSLGNECSAGEAFSKMYSYLKEKDTTRFIHYESVFDDAPDYDFVTDVYSYMYKKPEDLEKLLKAKKDKPHLLCEFSHAMGNSCGSNGKYISLLEKYPHFQGMFIWDFADQALLTKTRSGKSYFAYGGDFGDTPNDGAFCGNGLFFADRKPTPKTEEMKYLFQNVQIKAVAPEKGIIEITNNFAFTNLKEFNLHWQQFKEGVPVDSGDTELDIAPGETKRIEIAIDTRIKQEWYLNIMIELKDSVTWAKAGHIIAREQFVINEFKLPHTSVAGEEITAKIEYGTIYIYGGEAEYRFNVRTGRLYYMRKGENVVFNTPVEPNFWRALTDNDRGNHQLVRCACWKNAGRDASFELDSIKEDGERVVLSTSFEVNTCPKSRGKIIYTFTTKAVHIDYEFTPEKSLPELPEISLLFEINKVYTKLHYLGKGPAENYIDRNNGTYIGLHKTKIEDMLTPYLKPQENGERTSVRYALLIGEKSNLRIEADREMELNVSLYTQSELERAGHTHELKPGGYVYTRVVLKQMGVGGYDSWGAFVPDEYRIKSGETYKYGFTLIPE